MSSDVAATVAAPVQLDWDHFPQMLKDKYTWEEVLEQIQPHCREYVNKLYGKEYPARRVSCVVGVAQYGELHVVDWDTIPIVKEVRDWLTENMLPKYEATDQTKRPVEKKFVYCLVHLYRDGRDQHGRHSDREALSTPVASVTFTPHGASRAFQFFHKPPRGQKKNYSSKPDHELQLAHGDVLIMKAGCQRRWKHAVPEVKPPKVKKRRKVAGGGSSAVDDDPPPPAFEVPPRVNLTFRFGDPCGICNPTSTASKSSVSTNSKKRKRN